MKIVVAGAGVVGLACAYELLRDGHQVTVLDTGRAGSGASHGNAAKIAISEATPVPAPGMILQGLRWMLKPDSPLYVKPSPAPDHVRFLLAMAACCTKDKFLDGLNLQLRLAATANDVFDEWQDAGLDFEMHTRGVLLTWEHAEGLHERLEVQDVFAAWGHEPQVLDVDGIHQVEPALSDRQQHGLFYPNDRQIEPDSLTAALVASIRQHGGEVREHEAITGFTRSRGETGPVTGVLTSAGERLACDHVVLAAGVYTPDLGEMLGVRLPLRPGKGYSVDYRPAPIQLRTSMTLEDARIAITPLDGMLRLAGTMEFSERNHDVSTRRVNAIVQAAKDNFTDWPDDPPQEEPWSGMRPMLPDGLPVIGFLAPGANVTVASGHSMLGLTLAPTTARSIRDLIAGREAEDPQTSPSRFTRAAAMRTRSRSFGPRAHHRLSSRPRTRASAQGD